MSTILLIDEIKDYIKLKLSSELYADLKVDTLSQTNKAICIRQGPANPVTQRYQDKGLAGSIQIDVYARSNDGEEAAAAIKLILDLMDMKKYRQISRTTKIQGEVVTNAHINSIDKDNSLYVYRGAFQAAFYKKGD